MFLDISEDWIEIGEFDYILDFVNFVLCFFLGNFYYKIEKLVRG